MIGIHGRRLCCFTICGEVLIPASMDPYLLEDKLKEKDAMEMVGVRLQAIMRLRSGVAGIDVTQIDGIDVDGILVGEESGEKGEKGGKGVEVKVVKKAEESKKTWKKWSNWKRDKKREERKVIEEVGTEKVPSSGFEPAGNKERTGHDYSK